MSVYCFLLTKKPAKQITKQLDFASDESAILAAGALISADTICVAIGRLPSDPLGEIEWLGIWGNENGRTSWTPGAP